MDIGRIRTKLLDFIKKYKYVTLVVLLGIVLLLIPTNKISSNQSQKAEPTQSNSNQIIKDELELVLSQVEGAGKVKIYLMTAEGEETIYQTNNENSEDSTGKSSHIQTVTVTDAEHNERGLVKKVNPPKYSGAIIVCEGADDAQVQLMLIRAVANVTGLGTNKISVLKMK